MQKSDFIQALPKAELHLHIEGALPWWMIQRRVTSWPSPPPWWSADYRFDNFPHFARVMSQCYESTLTSAESYYLAAQGIFDNLLAQDVRYVELSYSIGHAVTRGLSQREIVEAIKQAAPPNLIVRIFCGLSRSRPELLREGVLDAVLDLPGLDGLDLHGDETAQEPAAFAPLFAQARGRGLAVKAHAGELAGPRSMRETIDVLRLRRVEHGVTAVRDEQLMAKLAAEAITLDMCPTSNVKLRVVAHASAHPIGQFHRRGIPVTVSTDNPTILGCSLSDELHLLVGVLGFSLRDVVQLQVNAFRVAAVSEPTRVGIMAELDELLAHAGA